MRVSNVNGVSRSSSCCGSALRMALGLAPVLTGILYCSNFALAQQYSEEALAVIDSCSDLEEASASDPINQPIIAACETLNGAIAGNEVSENDSLPPSDLLTGAEVGPYTTPTDGIGAAQNTDFLSALLAEETDLSSFCAVGKGCSKSEDCVGCKGGCVSNKCSKI